MPDADPSVKAASKKKRKSKKKTNGPEKGTSGDVVNETHNGGDADPEDAEGEVEDEDAPAGHHDTILVVTEESEETVDAPTANGKHENAEEDVQQPEPSQDAGEEDKPQQASDTEARLEAMARDRDALRNEVAELRKSLEGLQEKHEQDLSGLKDEVEEAQSGKETAEEQYRTLLGKVNTIRSQLGERLKADAEELAQARGQIEQLQDENSKLQSSGEEYQSSISRLQDEVKANADEISTLRNRTSLSQSNWVKERDELNSQLAFAREEFETAKQAMQDWEVLAMEERSIRESQGERTAEMEEQLQATREAYQRAAEERDGQSSTVDGLQRALQGIQEARRSELREMVESSQAQLDALRKQADEAAQTAAASATALASTQKELERALPFEKEVKEKNLLIGKLRHEAVILNDHLTKALRFLKRGKPEDSVDRQIVTNHLLHFLALDRSDPKKFQILQLIAALLGWSEEQREQAGLARPGASNISLRIPLSPFRRTPSTPALSDFAGVQSPGGNASRESLAELWSDFLEREAQSSGGEGSRRGSVAQNQRSASLAASGTSPTRSPPPATRPGLGIRSPSGSNHVPE